MYEGGTIILATGVIGVFVYLVSMVVLCIAHRRALSHYRMAAMVGLYVSTGLLVLGIVLYAYKNNAGYSFILMTLVGFMYFSQSRTTLRYKPTVPCFDCC